MFDLYQADLMDHYQRPRNKGVVVPANFQTAEHNPSCGDYISFTAQIDPVTDIIQQIKFDGRGCVISLATASKLTELLLNQNFNYIAQITPEDILKLVGLTLGPTRLRCALLSLEALQKASE
ncbi:MAG TPA: iron-sulfur cluster assembly scaffold protein [Candidatus Babeliales bacterium]|nr:iron-sulfur cluster assembly scaffold protein [Candidatus Babeliales bacterium]